jgi:hypothetical protein
MKIVKITNQHRRDFTADMECEFCGDKTKLDSGYDDDFYHRNVIPGMVCKKCNQSTLTGGGTIGEVTTKYPEGFQV